MTNSGNTTKIIILLIGLALSFSIGFFFGSKYNKTQDKTYGIILDSGPKLEEIQNVTNEFLKAWNNGDAEGCAYTYAEDAVFMPPDLPSIHGRAEIMVFFEEQRRNNSGEMEIAEKVQEVIYFEDWAVMRGLGEISVQNTDSTLNKFQFKWAMLSKKNPEGKWESVWDIYNDIGQ